MTKINEFTYDELEEAGRKIASPMTDNPTRTDTPAGERERIARAIERYDQRPDWSSILEVIAAARAILSPPSQPVGGWRPISEAPRDGTRLLLFGVGRDEQGWISTSQWNPHFEYPGWTVIGPYAEPTHWQPLPAPPSPIPSSDAQGEQQP